MSEVSSKINPLYAGAAIAVIIFSAVGVGVMTGIIPSSKSSSDTPALTEVAKAPAVDAKPVPEPEAKAPPAPAPAVKAPPEHRRPAPVVQKRAPVAEPPAPPMQMAANEPTAAPPPPVIARICNECGVIDAINVVDKKGSGSGLGAVGGAVVGGLLGKQVGQGRGNTVATVVGAVGGALAGNEVEKRAKATQEFHVIVRMENGGTQDFTFDSAPAYVIGEKVKVIDGKLIKG
jgi:hypothetical protein